MWSPHLILPLCHQLGHLLMQTIRLSKLSPLLFAWILPVSSALATSVDAVDLLNRMNDAQQQVEYSGKLVFIRDGEPSTLSVEQTIENGVRKETITPLDHQSSQPMKETTASLSLSSFVPITPEMQSIYSFDLGEVNHVAGRPCQIVIARPKDRKRYLQRYCVDIENNVLLEYSLTNLERKSVERFMFTDFHVKPSNNIANPVSVSLAGDSSPPITRPPVMSAATVMQNKQEQRRYSKWIFDPLPAGFRMVQLEAEGIAQNDNQKEEHLIVTDGLSSVSIFIAKDVGGQTASAPPVMKSGALNILTQVKDEYTITLVGEVPRGTLQDIYAGLRASY